MKKLNTLYTWEFAGIIQQPTMYMAVWINDICRNLCKILLCHWYETQK